MSFARNSKTSTMARAALPTSLAGVNGPTGFSVEDDYDFDEPAVPVQPPVSATANPRPQGTLLAASGLRAAENRPEESGSRFVTRRPERREPTYRFQLLQQWEGVVRVVGVDEFTATLFDLTDNANLEEEATFSLEEISDADQNLVAPGAVFYWSIGYKTTETGQKERVSMMRFRRMAALSRSERAAAAQEALQFERDFGLYKPASD